MERKSVDSTVRRACLFRGFFLACVLCVPSIADAQGILLISEFRVRGPNGANDEFIEIYNNSDINHTVASISGSGYAVAASDGVARCVIPNGTVIPGRGHYLCVNSVGYSLASYPAGNGTTATGDATYTTDIPDNAGIALFNNSTGGGSYSLANRFDAVGSTSEANTLYKEGTGYPALTPFSIDYSFTRKVPGGCDNAACMTQAASSRRVDTNNNASDFLFLDTNGTSAGAGQRLGIPGPENLSAPISRDGFAVVTSKLDQCGQLDAPPNQVRDFTSDPPNNSTFGTIDLRRTFTNMAGVPITRLRFRILDLTTFPAPSGIADTRPRTSTSVVVTTDQPPCGSGTSNVTVQGTTLEQPPSQPNGSGFNGSLSVGSVTLATPLVAGASINVRFLLGLQQTGTFRFCAVAETLPASSSQVFCIRDATDGATSPLLSPSDFNGDGTSDRAVFQPSTGFWLVHNQPTVQWGAPGDIPVAGDYNGDGMTDRAVYRPSNGAWFVHAQNVVVWGAAGDIPVPGNYSGSGTTERAVYRPLNGTWFVHNGPTVQWGVPGDIPVPGDYNGDGTTDLAVFRPLNGTWFVRNGVTVQWGSPGDTPIPGDYNGDGITDIAVYRPTTGQWIIRTLFTVGWGSPGDVPVPGDYNGDGITDIAVYRPLNNTWFVQNQAPVALGGPGDLPVPRPELMGDVNADGTTDVGGYLGDFNGNGTTDIVVYRSGFWLAQGQGQVQWGLPGDIPVPGDYNGDLITDRAVYRVSNSTWYVQGGATQPFGAAGDIPVPADYDGNGTSDIAVYRPSAGVWFVLNGAVVVWGVPGDVPVPGDYNGDGAAEIAVYRPSTGHWFIRGVFTTQWGAPGDIPVPGDYNGDGTTDIAVYRTSTGTWLAQGQAPVLWGGPGDLPVPGDFNADGVTDQAVFRPSTLTWFVRNQFTVQWGVPGDIPASRAYVPR